MRLDIQGPLAIGERASSPPVMLRCAARTQILLASLAAARGSLPRSTLLERMWPEAKGLAPDARTNSNLDGYVSKARALLGDHGGAIQANKGERSLVLHRPGSPTARAVLATDIGEYQALSGSSHVAHLEKALDLVRGPVLSGIDAAAFPWVLTIREQLAKDYARVIHELTKWPLPQARRTVDTFMDQPHGTLLHAISAADHDPGISGPERTSRQDVESVLAQSYAPHAPNVRTLAQLVDPLAAPYYDAIVSLELCDVEADKYELSYSLEVTTHLDEYVLALTTRASVTDLVIAECPGVTDSFTCSSAASRAALQAAILSPASPLSVWCLETAPNGSTRRRPVSLRRDDTKPDSNPLISTLDRQAADDIVLMKGRVPGKARSARRLLYRVRDRGMDISEHYAFWVADRPTFVNRIRIDASKFSRAVHVHPLIGNIAHEWEWVDQQCDMAINNWLVRNQGVFLTW
jgi:hypothetical protein